MDRAMSFSRKQLPWPKPVKALTGCSLRNEELSNLARRLDIEGRHLGDRYEDTTHYRFFVSRNRPRPLSGLRTKEVAP